MNTTDAPVRACVDPRANTAVDRPPLRGDETHLYRRYERRLVAITRRNTGSQYAEDGCQFAWLQLLRFQPDRDHVLGWLAITARRETVRIERLRRREPASDGPFIDETGQLVDRPLGERTPQPRDCFDLIAGKDALRVVADLPERQRRVLARRLAGLSYAELQVELGWSYTQVNRHLTRARRSLREAAA